MNTYSSSALETQKIGEKFTKKVKSGTVICLYGNLGAGKTTFVQGFAKGLEIKKRIISPTFTIARTYDFNIKNTNKKSKTNRLIHVDLYRLNDEEDIENIGLLDILKDKSAIIIIEWPEKLGMLLPKNRWEIYFKILDEDKREIRIIKT